MTRDDVIRAVLAERGGAAGSWPWTARFLDAADERFAGRWRRVTLTGTDALAVRLPAHAGEPCHGDRRILVPPDGGTVGDAARTFGDARAGYARDNPECCRRIEAAAAEPLTTVILSVAPVVPEHPREVAGAPGTLYHLDGFHRLVGWAWAGRLGADASVDAFVAG